MTNRTLDTKKKRARIFVVDDHPIIREGLAALIANEPSLQLCGSAEEVSEALTKVANSTPDLIIVDISLKSGNGIDLVKRLKEKDEHVRILVWSMYPENLYAERALQAGALGYVHKGRAADLIIQAIHAVLAGGVYLSDEMSATVLTKMIGGKGNSVQSSSVETLTDRELEAFELLGLGLSTREVAKRMHISPKTAETYRCHIKTKLQIKNSGELIYRAVQWLAEKS